MKAIPVLQHGRRAAACLTNGSLPLFYMNDYSVLGLQVSDLDLAYRVLADQHVTIEHRSDYLKLQIQQIAQVPEIVSLLNRNGIHCGLSDIADQIYQG